MAQFRDIVTLCLNWRSDYRDKEVMCKLTMFEYDFLFNAWYPSCHAIKEISENFRKWRPLERNRPLWFFFSFFFFSWGLCLLPHSFLSFLSVSMRRSISSTSGSHHHDMRPNKHEMNPWAIANVSWFKLYSWFLFCQSCTKLTNSKELKK